MRPMLRVGVAILLVAGGASAQNLLVNPSFEEPDVEPGTAQTFGFIAGWTDATLCGIEVQDNCCGSPFDGSQHLELDSFCPSQVVQQVPTVPGSGYIITLHYSPRPGLADPAENAVEVLWNGSVVLSMVMSGNMLSDTAWEPHAVGVTATGSSATIEVRDSGFGIDDGVGGYIDNMPEPGRGLALASGAVLLAALARRRSI